MNRQLLAVACRQHRRCFSSSSSSSSNIGGTSPSSSSSSSAAAAARTSIMAKKSKFQKNPFLYAGLPLIIMVIAGTSFLTTFLETRMEIEDKKQKQTSIRQFSLEEEHKKMMSQLDIDNYSLSRIPRPDDDADKNKKKKDLKANKSS